MHWDLRQARTFIAVAESLSFSSTARALNTTQSAVSRTVAQMEADLRVPLLKRTTRSVALTAEGRLLLDECREVVAHFDRWLLRARRVADGSAGLVSIGVNDFSVQSEVPRLLERFHETFPEITYKIVSATREAQLAGLDQGTIDIGFAMGPLSHPRYQTRCTNEYGLNCLVHARHPLARRDSVRLTDLASETLILGGPETWKAYYQFLKRAFDAVAMPLNISQVVEESVAIFGLVAAGTGVSLYPDCQDYIQVRDVVKVPVAGLHEKVQTVAVWRDDYQSQAARTFIEFIRREAEWSERADRD
jgi:DNA-binding transcriptional LysR family regulator